MTGSLSPLKRSERMARVRASDTKPERALRHLVWSMGYRYRKNAKSVPGKPDLSFVGKKRAIFLHGCFWHRHDCAMGQRTPKSRVEFWTTKFEKNVERDATVASELEQLGWRSLIVWECELCKADQTRHRVKEFLDA